MDGWRCRWCGAKFDEPVMTHEWNYTGPETGYESLYQLQCPSCGDDDIEEYSEEVIEDNDELDEDRDEEHEPGGMAHRAPQEYRRL